MNLLDLKFSCLWKITSDCVQDDHYALDNLISDNEDKRRIGFMAYSISKPPITIKLECKYKFKLDIMKVYSVLSSLKSTNFNIFVEITQDEKTIMKKIAEINLENHHIGFCLKSFSKNNNIDTVDDSLKSVEIGRHLQRFVENINNITIVIRDTKFKRSPVIRKIEIFGSFDENEEILGLCKNGENETTDKKLENNSTTDIFDDDDESTFKIPEEFLDMITHEILTLPYILPSGAVVDQSTLERYNRNEESYGRYASDPFTNVPYSQVSQPIFNAVLKMRLDEFKLRHSNEIEVKKCGRTVGKKEEICLPSTSKQEHVSKKIKLSQESSSLDDIIKSIYKNGQISCFTKKQSSPTNNSKFCRKCNSLESTKILYKISMCDHIFCKDCLIELKFFCFVCKTSFENKDVMKINL